MKVSAVFGHGCKVVLFITMLSMGIFSCKGEDDDEISTSADSASENVANLNDNLLPDSLSFSQSNLINPCESADGFFDCQPSLLKLYLSITKEMLEGSSEVLNATKEHMGGLAGKGERTFTGEDISKVEFDVISASKFAFRFFNQDEEAFMHMEVDETEVVKNYSFYFAVGLAPDADEENSDIAEIQVAYTDEENFDAKLTINGLECDNDDVRAPSKIRLNVARKGDVWQGKAMIFQALFNVDGDATCDTESNDDTQNFLYTDFAGTNDETSASVYMLTTDATDVDDFADFQLSDFCTTHPNWCSGGKGFGDPNPVSSYENPICVSEDSYEWNSDCQSVTVDDYSSESNWLLPEVLADLETSLPSGL